MVAWVLWRCSPSLIEAFWVSGWQTKHKGFSNSCVGERGWSEPSVWDEPSLTAAFILLLFLFHTPGFLGLPISFAVSFLSLPHSLCHRAVIGCYDRDVAKLSASSKARFNYFFSPTWHFHAQMLAQRERTLESRSQGRRTNQPTELHAGLSSHKNKRGRALTEPSVSHLTNPPRCLSSFAELWGRLWNMEAQSPPSLMSIDECIPPPPSGPSSE